MQAASQLGSISSHFKTEFHLTVCACTPFPLLLLKGPSFSHLNVSWVPGSFSFWLVVGPLHSSITLWSCTASLLAFYTTTGTIGFPWRSWLGLSWFLFWHLIAFLLCYLLQYSCPLLGLIVSFLILWVCEGMSRLVSVELPHLQRAICWWWWWLLETLAVIVFSVHGVLVHLGDSGALGALSDSVEPSLLEVLPLVSLEAVSVVSPVSMVDEDPGLLSNVLLVSAALLSANEPVSGTLSWSPFLCSSVSSLVTGVTSVAGVIRSMGQASKGCLGCGGLLHSLNGMYLVCETGLSGKVMALSSGASEMRLTAVSLSELSGGSERTEFCVCSTGFSPSASEMTEFSLETALFPERTGFCCRFLSEMWGKSEPCGLRCDLDAWGFCQCLQTPPGSICSCLSL